MNHAAPGLRRPAIPPSANLAYAYESAGDLGRAIPLYEQALTDCIRALGEDHPTLAVVRDNLAAARQQPE